MIEVQGVSKLYGSVQALDDVHVRIEEGSSFGLVGPNGAGKSTLMKLFVGVLLEFDGDICVDGHSVKHNRLQVKKMIGYVPQDICLEETLTARDNLALFGKLYGLSGTHLQERMAHVLKLIGLHDRAKDRVSTFSGGMKRRLNIGCALLHEPNVVVLDEPTVGIDPQSRHSIFTLIQQLKAAGSTIVYSSHYMEEVEQLCDHVGFIDQGKLVEHGSMKHVLEKHRHSSIFVSGKGIAKANIASFGEVKAKDDGYVIESDDSLGTLENMISAFRQQGISPNRLELSQAKLEDIFFELTSTELRDNG